MGLSVYLKLDGEQKLNNNFPEFFNKPIDHLIMTNELIIAAMVSMKDISQIKVAISSKIANTLVGYFYPFPDMVQC